MKQNVTLRQQFVDMQSPTEYLSLVGNIAKDRHVLNALLKAYRQAARTWVSNQHEELKKLSDAVDLMGFPFKPKQMFLIPDNLKVHLKKNANDADKDISKVESKYISGHGPELLKLFVTKAKRRLQFMRSQVQMIF